MKTQLTLAAAIISIVSAQVRFVAAYEADLKHNKVTVTSVSDFNQCARDFADSGGGDYCLAGLRTFVKAHPAEAFAAGKSVRLNFNHWVALAFFDGPLTKPNPQQCADEDVQLAVVSGLALPAEDPNAKIARRIAAGPCWGTLQPKLLAEFADGGAYYEANTCPVFRDHAVAVSKCAPPVANKTAEAPKTLRSAKVAKIDARSLTLDPTTALLFRGQEREEVLLVRPKGKDDVMLVKIKGVRGSWNNRVLVTQEAEGTGGYEYVANVDGDDYVVVTQIDGDYEVYPQGYKDGVQLRRVALAEEKKTATASTVVKEFGTTK